MADIFPLATGQPLAERDLWRMNHHPRSTERVFDPREYVLGWDRW
ncbi:hypothetical protein ACSNOI_13520 [Actinomadura kijaniata]